MTTTDCLMLIGWSSVFVAFFMIASTIRTLAIILDWDQHIINTLSRRIEKLESAAKPARSANGRFCGKGNAKNE